MTSPLKGIEILSVTKPIAIKDRQCAWNDEHTIHSGKRYVRVTWKDRRTDRNNPTVNYDHICIDCWTKN